VKVLVRSSTFVTRQACIKIGVALSTVFFGALVLCAADGPTEVASIVNVTTHPSRRLVRMTWSPP